MQNGDNVVLFDGTCGFCRGAVRFIIRHDPRAVFRFAPLQSDVAEDLAGGCDEGATAGTSLVLIREGHCHSRSEAALMIAAELAWPWRLCRACRLIPRPVRDWIYNQVARHRHRLAGDGEDGPLGERADRERFIADHV
ncbi:MAG: DUF393 domain-containing protein [Lentisphaerae bacterium]|nr:DUF393 domain-containing protein [Lentisphaerota bacterium]